PCAVMDSGSDTATPMRFSPTSRHSTRMPSYHLYTYLRTYARAIAAQNALFRVHLRAPVHDADGVLAAPRRAAPAALAPVVYHQMPLARGQRRKQAEVALKGAHIGVDLGKGLHAHRHRVDPRPGEDIGKRLPRG